MGGGKRKCDGIYGGRGLVGGGLKLEDVWVDTFPMVIVVRVTDGKSEKMRLDTNVLF